MTAGASPPRQPTVSRAPPRSFAKWTSAVTWLRRETVAQLGVAGAAITILAQLANVMPVAPPLAHLFIVWQQATHVIWIPPLRGLGIPIHPHLVAALNSAFFMTMIGIGARISARLSGQPLAPFTPDRFFDGLTWPSLIVFAALCIVFLLGPGGDPAHDRLVVFGSEKAGAYAFASITAVGYFLGDFIGHREFHIRLYRLAATVVALTALNLAAVFALARWA